MTPKELAQAARREFGDARLVSEFSSPGSTNTDVFIEVRRFPDAWRRIAAVLTLKTGNEIALRMLPKAEPADKARLQNLLVL